jgi:DNA polymerase-1
LDKAIPYACQDADITLRAARHFSPMIEKSGLIPLFRDMEMPLVKVLMDMEMRGIRVDRDRLSALSVDFAKRIKILEGEIHDRAGEKFNIKSSQQLGRILFEKLKLPTQKKTAKKTGYSTDVEVLTALAEQHELPGLVLEHRSLSKLKSTYADALLGLIHPQTGRIHTSFNQTVTATGRLSSSDPNLQNIPIRTEEGRAIRAAFVPDKGCLLLGADYSQIELRILAHVSRDPILIRSFLENEDIHTRTASEVFGIDDVEVTPDLRRQAKAINFGIIYGMSPYGLSKELSISRKMAENYINMYFGRYQKVREYLDKTVEKARETRSTQTLLGRIRNIPEISSSRHPVRQFAERTAINTPIQGTAADLLKLAMIKVEKDLKSKGLAAKMLLTVHDELVFEVPEDQIEKTQRIVVDSMESVWDLKVPLVVNAQAGPDWATAH